jgi:tRNA dimethylallyltransferase
MKPLLLVIVGPTAVGKTELSLKLAERWNGEIISGDSMQVYRGMDIGTAKASPEERARIPHHLIDIIDPGTPFSVQEYQRLARAAIEEIHGRGKLPVLVGGTGLYIEAVTHDYEIPHVPENATLRRELRELAEREGNEALHARLAKVDPETANHLHPNDIRRIIRALEVHAALGVPFSRLKGKGTPRYDALWIGLTMPREQLYERINRRVDLMLEQGLVEEVKRLKEQGFHSGLTSMQAIGYKEIISYLEGNTPLEEAVRLIKKGTRQYAKRQLSWFRRLPEIHWFDVSRSKTFEEILRLVAGKFGAPGE